MIKKLSVLISLVLAMSFLIVGCGPNKDEIKSSANTLLQGMKDVDFDKIKSQCSEEGLDVEDIKVFKEDYLLDELMDEIGVSLSDISEDNQKAVKDFCDKILNKLVEDYKIEDVQANSNIANVNVKVKMGLGEDFAKIFGADLTDEFQGVIDKYKEDNLDELSKIYIDKGEDAMQDRIYNDLIPIVLDIASEKVDKAEAVEEDMVVILKKQNDKWLVSDFGDREDAEVETEE